MLVTTLYETEVKQSDFYDSVELLIPDSAESPVHTAADAADTAEAVDTEAFAAIAYGSDCWEVDDVAYYLYTYSELPPNYITKSEAETLGWISSEGNLWEVAPGAVIGGDRFGNYEGLLPEDGTYTECDVNYEGGFRGGERLVFDEDFNVWYTADHYASFEQLYPQ